MPATWSTLTPTLLCSPSSALLLVPATEPTIPLTPSGPRLSQLFLGTLLPEGNSSPACRLCHGARSPQEAGVGSVSRIQADFRNQPPSFLALLPCHPQAVLPLDLVLGASEREAVGGWGPGKPLERICDWLWGLW